MKDEVLSQALKFCKDAKPSSDVMEKFIVCAEALEASVEKWKEVAEDAAIAETEQEVCTIIERALKEECKIIKNIS